MGGGKTADTMGSPNKTIKKPKTLVCYIWYIFIYLFWNSGREFGTSSLEIHLKSCKQKWEIEESKKPKGQRRPVP